MAGARNGGVLQALPVLVRLTMASSPKRFWGRLTSPGPVERSRVAGMSLDGVGTIPKFAVTESRTVAAEKARKGSERQ